VSDVREFWRVRERGRKERMREEGVAMARAFASKMDECGSVMKSVLTTSSSVYARMPLSGPSAAFLMVAQISSYGAL